ncbi:hypothetical protein JL720_9247 [Aureococcus anophagefferens]|nr:hypothetical protein JL720_9247 [Aureococcus anophagefferens]
MSDDTGGAPPDDAPAPAPAPAPPAPPEDEQSAPAYRVKVYRLNEDGQWDDCGTGSVTLAKGSAPTILVLSENNDRGARGALLASRLIPSQDAYTKQGENIITWDTRRGDGGSAIADKAANETACVALSFQEKHGCDDLYARLQAAAARLIAALSRSRSLSPPATGRAALRDDEPGPPGVDDDGDAARAVAVLLRRQAEAEAGQFGGGSGDGGGREPAAFTARAWHALPAPSSAAALDEWACTLARAAASPAAKERYAATLLAEDCLLLRQLAASFDDAEDGDDVEVLVKLADVVKLVVLLNEPPLVEALLDDPLFEPVLGALEYAADLKKQHAALAVDDGAAPRERRSWVEPSEARRARASGPAPRRAPPAGAADADAEVAAATAAAPDDDDEAANRRASMREVVPMEDATLRMRVVQNFRAAVLKEAALRPGMDDAQLSSIHGLVFSNNNEILRRLYDHTDYLKRVVALVGSGAPEAAAESLEADLLEDGDGGAEAAHRRDRGLALRFLREMVGLSRNAQPQSRDALYRHLFFETELYGALATALADCGHRSRPSGAGGDGYAHTAAAAVERACCAEIVAAASRPASSLRHDALRREDHRSRRRGTRRRTAETTTRTRRRGRARGRRAPARLLRAPRPRGRRRRRGAAGPALFWVLRLLACDGDLATLMHASDAARLVLDSETMDEPERDAFLALFYDKYLPWLVEPLYDVRVVGGDGVEVPLEDAAPGPGLRVANGAACAHVCELLAYCVRAHAYRMKYFVLRNHVAARVVALVECGGAYGDKPLVLAALRFVRACVGAKDDFYTRYLVKNGSLGPVFRLLGNAAAASPAPPPPEDDGDATNDTLAEFVRVENVKGLVAHIVEVHGATLKKSVLHRSLLEGLETRHAQNKDLLERAARGFGGAKDDAPLTAAQLERRARIATEDADEAYAGGGGDFDDDMDDASDDDEAPGAPPGPPPGFAPREAARRRPPGRSPTPPTEDDSSDSGASGDSASSRHRAKRG